MTILFKYPAHSFLPEIFAYNRFFEKMGVQVIANDTSIEPDVCWELMGFQLTRSTPAKVYIDEYSSASTPPFKSIKDSVKSVFNRKPDYRLFLNPYVNNSFNFKDRIPYGYRDMGVDRLETSPISTKSYDFIYTGSLEKHRKITELLKIFTDGAMRGRNILILSKDYAGWQHTYRKFDNIAFAGPCEPCEVSQFLQKAKYGVNFIPDIEPFNQQTSTKLLEYAANGLPIITTRYHWVQEFEKKYGGRFFYVDEGLSNLTEENLLAFRFITPDISGWTWDNQILNSGVLQFLEQKFPGFTAKGKR